MKYKLHQLENGLKVIAVATPIFKSIHTQIAVKGGSSIETKENNGISHFVEHMVFEGTKNFPDTNKFDEEIELLGGNYNGSTSRHKVLFTLSLPDDKLEYSLDYMADITQEALFPDKALKSERSAIIDEIHNYENDPYKKFGDFWTKYRYTKETKPLDLPGTKSGIKKMPKNKLIEWYKYLLSPNNMTITIVGNIDPDKAIAEIEKRFGSRENHMTPITEETYSKQEFSNQLIKTQVDKSAKQSIGTISFPGLSMFNDDYKTRQTAKILEAVIVNYNSSILYKKLRKEMGIIYSIYGSQSFGNTSPGFFEIGFTTSDDKMLTVYEIVLDELEKLRKNGISQELLTLGIESGNNALKMGYSSIGQVISWYSGSVFWFNRVRTFEEAIEVRKSIDLDYANNLLHRMLNIEKMNIISRVNSTKVKKELEKNLEQII